MEKTHKATLLLALEDTNKKYAEYDAHRLAESERERVEQQAHEEHVRDASKKIKFD